MNFFGIGKMLTRQQEQSRASEGLKTEADKFELATDGGYIKLLKYALFVLFGYYNARLFIVTVQGWEGYLTATFALLGEATALYCFNNYPRSTSNHQKALGVFAALLMLFSATHATISFFRMESGSQSGIIRFYCERVAFPLLFSLLLLAAVITPLLHWRRKIAEKQAEAQVMIASSRAKLVADSAAMRDENELERARIDHFKEKIKMGNEYVEELKGFARMKKSERDALLDIPEPLRSQIACELGIDITEQQTHSKPVAVWRGNEQIGQRPN